MSASSDEFRQVYLRNLPHRIETLDSCIRNLGAGEPDALKKARAFVHSLAGSGGTYGFPEISALAKETEKTTDEAFIKNAHALLALLRKIGSDTQRKFNLLVVEDDPDIFQIHQVKLQSPGRNVFLCSNAQEAEDVLQNNSIDFIITDLTLP